MQEFENYKKKEKISNVENLHRQQGYHPSQEYTQQKLSNQFQTGPGFVGTLRTILHSGGWKATLLKGVLYIVLPLIIIGLIYYVINGTLSPKSFLSLIKSKNRSGETNVPQTGIEVKVDDIQVNTTVTDKERNSYDYITKLLENIDNLKRQQ